MRTEVSNRTDLCLQIICVLLGVMGLLAYAISKFSAGKAVVIVTAVGVLGCLGTLIALAVRAKRLGRIVGRVAGTLIAVVLGMYLVLFGLIYFFQDTIANEADVYFQPRAISAAAAQALVADDVEALDWTTPKSLDQDRLGLERLIFFSDAVFAIAITLLALDIRLPDGGELFSDAQLGAALLGMWHKYLAYAISFFVIGTLWIGHQMIMALAALLGAAIWWYAARRNRLIDPHLDAKKEITHYDKRAWPA